MGKKEFLNLVTVLTFHPIPIIRSKFKIVADACCSSQMFIQSGVESVWRMGDGSTGRR